MILQRFIPKFNMTTTDMLSDISFGIVDTLPDAAVPKDKLPYVPGKTDVPALKSRCENNLDK